jgi:hypothetical protein
VSVVILYIDQANRAKYVLMSMLTKKVRYADYAAGEGRKSRSNPAGGQGPLCRKRL